MKTMFMTMLVLLMSTQVGSGAGVVEFTTKSRAHIVMHDTMRVATTIRNQIAVTTTTQSFSNVLSTKAGVRFAMTVPSGATVTGIVYTVNAVRKVAQLVSSDTVANGSGGAGVGIRDNLTAITGDMSLVFPIADSASASSVVTIEVTWVELLTFSRGTYAYSYPARAVVGEVVDAWTLDVVFDAPISSHTIESSTDLLSTSEPVVTPTSIRSTHRFTVTDTLLRFACKVVATPHTMDVLSCKRGNDDGYALFLTVPEDDRSDNASGLTKRVCLLYDISGSMEGIKFKQAKEAVTFCLDRLTPTDFVSVIAFGSFPVDLSQGMQEASAQNIARLKEHVQAQPLNGGTNIMGALSAALAQFKGSDDVNTIVFITDGRAPVQFEEIVKQNADDVRIYVFGVGQDVDGDLLRRISAENRGEIDLITDAGSVTSRIATFFEKISAPLIKNPSVAFSPSHVYDVCPIVLPDVYAGEQFVFAGRYTTPGPVHVTLTGKSTTGTQSTSFNGTLLDDSTTYVFVPKLWARLRINVLLDMMSKQQGQTDLWKEWRNEIIRLGGTYGIMTPFTTFTSSSDDPTDTDPTDAEPTSVYDYPVESHSLHIYPNPVQTTATIELDVEVPTDRISMEILSIDGSVIGGTTVYGSYHGLVRLPLDLHTLCTDGLTSGRYHVRITIGDEVIVATIIVVM